MQSRQTYTSNYDRSNISLFTEWRYTDNVTANDLQTLVKYAIAGLSSDCIFGHFHKLQDKIGTPASLH